MKTHSILMAAIAADPDNLRRSSSQDELTSLAESIKSRGLLLPLRCKPANAQGQYVLVSGHRRLEAMRQLGVREAPCIIVDGPLDEASVLAEQIVENMLRSNLNPIEEAQAYRRFLDLQKCTAAEAAKTLSISASRISRCLLLLTLPEALQNAVQTGKISADTAYHLGRLPESADREELIAKALQGGLSRDQAARASKTSKSVAADAAAVSRITCKLSNGRTLTLSGSAIRLDVLISTLEEVLTQARKARQQNLDVTTLAKIFRDRATSTEGGAA